MATAKINGVDIHYEVSGEGPAVVFLHGLMGSIARARRMGEAIEGLASNGFRLITYDARGHGESGFTPDLGDYTWASHGRDMAGLLDHLGLERAIVGGGSMGAGASIEFALAQPERVEKLLLLAPPPLADTIGTAQQVFCGLASLIEAVGVEQAATVVMGLEPFASLKQSDQKRYALMDWWLRDLSAERTPTIVRGLLNGTALPEGRFPEITAPTLIVAHPDDPIHPTSTAEKLNAAIAGSQVVMAPDMNYFRERPAELVERVVRFLREDLSTDAGTD
jgi:pimeloyl-ACP methyl ester carboxylesterase